MGIVFRAYDPVLDRDVALKVVREPSETARQRLAEEGRRLGRIRHPHVLSIYDAGSVGEEFFLATELLQGQTLQAKMDAGRLDLDLLRTVGRDIADALAALHHHGSFHRDVKPSNIFVTDGGTVVLVDFGLAGVCTASGTGPAGIVGTPRFMAPELADGPATAATDQYALAKSIELAAGAGGVRLTRRLRIALRRATASEPSRRFPDLQAFSHVFGARRSHRAWIVAGCLGVLLLAIAAMAASWGSATRTPDSAPNPEELELIEAIAAMELSPEPTPSKALRELDALLARVPADASADLRARAALLRGRVTCVAGQADDESAFVQAAELASEMHDDRFVVQTWLAAADCAIGRRRTTQAETYLRAAQAQMRRLAVPGELERTRHTVEGKLAGVLGEHERALEHFERAIVLTTEPGPRASIRLSKAVAELAMRDFSKALVTLRAALPEIRTAHGPEDPRLVHGLGLLAMAKDNSGDVDGAWLAYREALTLAERVHLEPEVRHAVLLVNAADLATRRGELEVAIEWVRRAVSIAAAARGSDSSLAATFRANLGSLLLSIGKAAEAEPHFEQALEVLLSSHEQGLEASVAQCRIGLSATASARGAHEHAIALAEEAVVLARGRPGDAHAQSAYANLALGRAHAAAGRLEDCRVALAPFERFGGDNPETREIALEGRALALSCTPAGERSRRRMAGLAQENVRAIAPEAYWRARFLLAGSDRRAVEVEICDNPQTARLCAELVRGHQHVR